MSRVTALFGRPVEEPGPSAEPSPMPRKSRGHQKQETAVVREILEYLARRGIMAWRCQSGIVRVKRGWMHLAPKGTADIVGVLPGGRFLAVEVKTDDGDLEPSQVEWWARIIAAGALYVLARGIEDVEEALPGHRHGYCGNPDSP
jgi:hypothetical protein